MLKEDLRFSSYFVVLFRTIFVVQCFQLFCTTVGRSFDPDIIRLNSSRMLEKRLRTPQGLIEMNESPDLARKTSAVTYAIQTTRTHRTHPIFCGAQVAHQKQWV